MWMKDQGRGETVMAAWGSSLRVIYMPIVSKKKLGNVEKNCLSGVN